MTNNRIGNNNPICTTSVKDLLLPHPPFYDISQVKERKPENRPN